MISDKLKKMREKAGMSQRQVTDKLGWATNQALSNAERGISLPPVEAIPVLAKLYGMDEKYLRQMVFDETLRIHEAKLRRKFKL